VQPAHPLVFLKGYLRNPRAVGSMVPSSQALAAAVSEPYRCCGRPAVVLEVGAGTGPITRYLGSILGPDDELDICELDNDFADLLARDVLTHADFAPAVAQGRVRLIRAPVQELRCEKRYDFIISGLPFNSFQLRDVEDVFAIVQRALKPAGVLSYYEYVAARASLRMFSVGKHRARIRQVSRWLSRQIAQHQFLQRTVFLNLPPARARHLRFD